MNKARLLFPIQGLLQLLPQWLIRLFYWPVILFYRLLGKVLNIQIWTRNSFFERNQVLFLSDVDFTVLLESPDQSATLSKLRFWQKFFKMIFPWMGESNILFRNSWEDFIPLMNAYEAKRDPVLSQKVPRPESDDIEKLLFIAHFLYSDRINLRTSIKLRKRKINKILALLNGKPFNGPWNLSALLDSFNEFLDSNSRGFFEAFIQDENLQSFQKEYLLIYPQHWIGQDPNWNHSPLLNELNDEEKKILKRALENEFWGMYNQSASTGNSTERLIHLEQLKSLWLQMGFESNDVIRELCA